MGKIKATMRQPAPQPQAQTGQDGQDTTVRSREMGGETVFSKLPGAIARALLVAILIALPTLMLTSSGSDSGLMVVILALFAGCFTISEYLSSSPSLVEFRDAPPFNRIRFGALFVTVLSLSIILSSEGETSTFAMLFDVIGTKIGEAIDFPYSPVRLMLLMMPADTPTEILVDLRTAAGLCYVIATLSIVVFVVILRLRAWPRVTRSFNFWINLPTFDPSRGGDVVDRLNRDSTINVILGFLLPFMIPAIIKATSTITGPLDLSDPQTMIWTVALWAFLPSSLLMRGVALSRVAGMVHVERKKAYAAAAAEGALPV